MLPDRRRLSVVALAVLLLSGPAFAADHADGPAATADPAADIADVYAWVSPNGQNVNLVMTFSPFATTASKPSTAVSYVFHTRSLLAFGATSSTSEDVICQFDAQQKISCWAGDEFVTGDASSTAGLSSASGKMKVFAGLRDDAFFFNLTGFKATAEAVSAASGSLTTDVAGCPNIDAATSAALVAQLSHGANGAAATDDFAHKNVLAIVVQLDKTVLTKTGPFIAVYGATHRR